MPIVFPYERWSRSRNPLQSIGTDTCRKALAAPGVDFRALTEGSLDLICLVEVKDYRHRFMYVTPSALDVVGWSAEELLQCGPRS